MPTPWEPVLGCRCDHCSFARDGRHVETPSLAVGGLLCARCGQYWGDHSAGLRGPLNRNPEDVLICPHFVWVSSTPYRPGLVNVLTIAHRRLARHRVDPTRHDRETVLRWLEERRGTKVCTICQRDSEDCTCWTCRGCDERFLSETVPCARCEACSDCCDCSHCNDCGQAFGELCECGGENCEGCCECQSGEIEHREVDGTFLGEPSEKFPRFVGIEIECYLTDVSSRDLSHMTDTLVAWGAGCHSDGSIEGEHTAEIVTCPARGEKAEAQVQEICRGLARLGAEVNTSCGLHVHVDARDLSTSQILAMARLYDKVEPALYEIVSPSRQKGQYSSAWEGKLGIAGAFDRGTQAERMERLEAAVYGSKDEAQRAKRHGEKHHSRYHGLNLNALVVHGTIEFRMHQGSVSSTKILNWAAVCSAIVEYAATHTENSIEKLGGGARRVLETVLGKKALITWTRERRARFLKAECQRRGVVVPEVAQDAEPLNELSEMEAD